MTHLELVKSLIKRLFCLSSCLLLALFLVLVTSKGISFLRRLLHLF
jgi:hypothetical protein